ncbi:hypothetical protein CVU76_01055 [Candidatus Dojkabacteria bacterium HGW-Dojkabacteria-1]|uniref:Uncharacterized protein n=1 Tax=Candidatus Dojkabacteria bacterium HGW-Dojkabacteria-1 TaxID=2013761 RepID=A0A2N2F319_9BACT|nr:MAG: hypothetical protein CVU76_01055 [Candidatus Dojkabacteria bacterium HGW-Dojkabacteria-1]
MKKDFNDKVLEYLLIFSICFVLITLFFVLFDLNKGVESVKGVMKRVVLNIEGTKSSEEGI